MGEDQIPEGAATAAPEPTHPGVFLRDAILPEVKESKAEIARRLGLSRRTLYDLLDGKQAVTPETALKLGRLFQNSPKFWLNMQAAWDLWRATQALGPQLDAIEPVSERPDLKAAARAER
jgi:addiction module HigA family antidote